MLTNKRKTRNRKQLFAKIFLIIGLIVFSVGLAYFIAWKFFYKSDYISPLSKTAGPDFSHQEDRDMASLEKKLKEQQIEFVSLNRQGNSYVIRLKDDGEVILSAEKELNSQISSLQFIHKRLTMEGKLFSQLDLRFDKPVIKMRSK